MLKIFTILFVYLISLNSFSKEVTVIVSPSAPMVMENGSKNNLKGFEIDLWERIAEELNLTTKYKKVYFHEIFKEMENGNADVALGGINVTSEREKLVDFSYPYMHSGRSILVKSSEEISYLAVLTSVVGNKEVIKTTLYLVLFICLSGFAFWVTERGKDAISDKFFPGIFEGIWLTFTTMSTVGYGDIAPAKWTGRIFAVLLMFTGISYFGYVATVFLNIDFEKAGVIKTVDQLKGKQVAVVKGTESAKYMKTKKHILIQEVNTEEQAHLKLATGHVDAVVTDHTSNLYFLKQDKYKEYGVYSEQFQKQGYGIVLKQNSKLKEKIDHIILQLKENGEYDKIYQRWFK